MTKQLSNRSNAERSTGPRTAEGKATSSQNALRHGLSRWNPATRHAQISAIAELLEDRGSSRFMLALELAEARAYLLDIHAIRLEAINRAAAPSQAMMPDGAVADTTIERGAAYIRSAPFLLKLCNYERRAQTRLRKAIEAYDAP